MSAGQERIAQRRRELEAEARERMLVWAPRGKGGRWRTSTAEERAAFAELEQRDAAGVRLQASGQSYARDGEGVWRRWEGPAA